MAWPVVEWNIALSTSAGRACTSHAVNAADGGVSTRCVGWSAPNLLTMQTEPIYLRHQHDAQTRTISTATGPPPAPLLEADLIEPWLAFDIDIDIDTWGSANLVGDRATDITTNGFSSDHHCAQTDGTGPHWLSVDLGAVTEVHAFGLEGYPGGSHEPTGAWALQGSNDGAAWDDVWTGSDSWSTTTGPHYPPRNRIDLAPPASYRCFRVYADTWTNGYMLICNFALYGHQPAAGVEVVEPTDAVTISSLDSDNPQHLTRHDADKTLGDAANDCVQTTGSGTDHWLAIDLGEPHTITAFGVVGCPSSGDGSHRPSDLWSLSGSTDGASWTIPATTPGSYRPYRLSATDWTNGYLIVCNLSLME